MKPGARIQSTIDLLEKIAASRVPMDATTGDYMRARRYIGSKDRAEIAERTYNIARARARLGWWLEKKSTPDSPRARVLAWLVLGEGKTADQIAALFDGSQHAPSVLTDEDKKFVAALPLGGLIAADMPDPVRVECPPEYERALRERFGGDFVPEMEAMMDSAPLDLRINALRAPARDEVKKSLAKDGVKTETSNFAPFGLRVQGKAFLSKTKAFTKGWVEIQDEGSQLVATLCDAKPGMQVLDYCAGAGGKTLALAASMNNKGRIVATDTEKGRLERARPRFRRAGVHDIIEVRPLSDEKNRKWLRRQKGTFDVVLADVPCSGSGTWRRNPDTRWKAYGPKLDELLQTQAEILDKVAKAVKPGGRFVYATCSLLPEENEKQVAAFLDRHPEFEIMPVNEAWPANAPAPCEGNFMRLTPKLHNTDGFFAAVLRRKPGAAPETTPEEEEE
ncbi:MAG TPA: RsmB/NOP family class I SAM-dependent RNA methyltransferase [Patescibacteria group bacterium]|nr:RsmB/NOP family class I SAM-dependent RNA methyltransferase [Patescibacteria group bacterium]